jgi:hypothetical protein
MSLTPVLTAALITLGDDASPTFAHVAAGTALDYTRADLRAGLMHLLRVTRRALADLDGPAARHPRAATGPTSRQPVPMPRTQAGDSRHAGLAA